MLHDPENHDPIRPEFWLGRALEILARMEATQSLLPGVGGTARLMLAGLESREIPPPTLDLVEHKSCEDHCLISMKWVNARGAGLFVVVAGRSLFYYRHIDGKGYDTGRMKVDCNHIDSFRWLMRKVFPGINAVKVEDRKLWWA